MQTQQIQAKKRGSDSIIEYTVSLFISRVYAEPEHECGEKVKVQFAKNRIVWNVKHKFFR